MKDLQKIKEFFSKPIEENTFNLETAVSDLMKAYHLDKEKALKILNTVPQIEKTINLGYAKTAPEALGILKGGGARTFNYLLNLEEGPTTFKKGDKVTYLGHPAEITAVNKEMTGEITYSVAYDKGQGRTKASNINLKSGAIKPLEEAKEPAHLEKVKNIVNSLPYRYNIKPDRLGMIKVTSRSKDELGALKTELDKANLYSQMRPTLAGMFELTISGGSINENLNPEVINKVNRFIKALAKYYDYSEQDAVYAIMQALRTTNFQGINEAKEEDAVDTITMDIPLFLRMLEYSREDAAQDLDLHDVTEKANKLGKERGILSMDDYEEIVGAAEDTPKEDMSEGMGGELDEPFFIRISVRDARKAMDMFDDMYRNSNIKTYGSDVYAADTPEDIYDFFYDLNSNGIEILDANVEDDENFYDSEYEKTLRETIKFIKENNPKATKEEVIDELKEIKKLGEQLNEELCEKGKRYIAARQAAGEKSSAYLSGRGVKVCKGSIEWPKKGKKK